MRARDRVVLCFAVGLAVMLCGTGAPAEGQQPPEGAPHLAHLTNPGKGWTAFRPAADSRIIYVSSSEGDDANAGLSPDRPLRSPRAGLALLRDGLPDWLLLKRGDSWSERMGYLRKSGRSPQEPLLIGSYGTEGPQPLLKLGEVGGALTVGSRGEPISNVAVVDLDFYNQKADPGWPDFVAGRLKQGAALSWAAPGEGFLVEGCRFRYTYGMAIVGRVAWIPPGADRRRLENTIVKNVTVRRCVVANAWTSAGHCQGIFASKVDGLLLEENVLDHNGWNLEAGDLPTWFNHDVYVTTNCDRVVARGNIISRGSSTGLYCRTNGVMEDNLCLENTPSLNMGRISPPRPGGVSGRIAGNVVINAATRRNRRRTYGGTGIELGNISGLGAVVENNILIQTNDDSGPAFKLSPLGVGVHNVVIRNNTVYNWRPTLFWTGTYGEEMTRLCLSGIVVKDNLFQSTDPRRAGSLMLRARDVSALKGFTFVGNLCWCEPAGLETFQLAGRKLTVEQWTREPGVKGDQARKVEFADAARDVGTYHATLGKEATLEAFLAEAHEQSKFNWRTEYTAAAVIAYIREGFRPKEDVAAGAGADPGAPDAVEE